MWAFENVRLADCVLESYGWHRRLKCGNEGGHLHLGINLTSTHTLLHCQCPLSKGMLKIGRNYGASQIHMRLPLKILVLAKHCTFPPAPPQLLFMNKFWTASAWTNFYPLRIFQAASNGRVHYLHFPITLFHRWERPTKWVKKLFW